MHMLRSLIKKLDVNITRKKFAELVTADTHFASKNKLKARKIIQER